MAFIKARVPSPKLVVYTDADGRETAREGGSRAWRNNNPGNITGGSFTDAHGGIGMDNRFGIFPDEATGRAAVIALLRTPTYSRLTLEQAIKRYAPAPENRSDLYAAFVAERTGIRPSTRLSTLDEARLATVVEAIKVIEGWKPGLEYAYVAPALIGDAAPAEPISAAASAVQEWMSIALAEAALPSRERSEWPDLPGQTPRENPRILRYFKVACPWFDALAQGGDEVSWCAAFANYCLEKAGFLGTGSPAARSFYTDAKHRFVKIDKPVYGCLVVFRDNPTDKEWTSGTGHVGFALSWTETHVTVLGGNQSDTVRSTAYAKVSRKGSKVTRKVAAYLLPAMN